MITGQHEPFKLTSSRDEAQSQAKERNRTEPGKVLRKEDSRLKYGAHREKCLK